MASEQQLRDYLRKVVAELHEAKRRPREPVAILGAGCRFPGAVCSPEDLWRLLTREQDVNSAVPPGRGWSGDDVRLRGGFLAGADEFDAGFFGLEPSAAAAMDPQHRLLLATTAEALARAGLDPGSLRGSTTAVYIGLTANDYLTSRVADAPPAQLAELAVGNLPNLASGRIAYTFGLHGPALTIDTACSSALVAVHLAVETLRARGCDLALAGGAAVMTSPTPFHYSAGQGLLSRDGRCRSYATGADGWGLAEGAGMLVLKRLGDALRDGDPVLAVVRGSAVNQVGAGAGFTTPSGVSQQAVIRLAWRSAGVGGDEVDAVEGHGTGTAFGDTLEVEALQATYGRNRPARRPLLLGSVKSNLGHTQASGGIAGLLKMALALDRGRLPRSLHAEAPSKAVEWADGGVQLLDTATPWPAIERPRRGAVSSFGLSGTNAHLIVEQAPAEAAGRIGLPVPEFRTERHWIARSRSV